MPYHKKSMKKLVGSKKTFCRLSDRHGDCARRCCDVQDRTAGRQRRAFRGDAQRPFDVLAVGCRRSEDWLESQPPPQALFNEIALHISDHDEVDPVDFEELKQLRHDPAGQLPAAMLGIDPQIDQLVGPG